MEKEIGKITHYFNRIGVAIINLEDEIKIGDMIHISGHSDDFTQIANSIQWEHQNIQRGERGKSIGLKVTEQVHTGDHVYKVVD